MLAAIRRNHPPPPNSRKGQATGPNGHSGGRTRNPPPPCPPHNSSPPPTTSGRPPVRQAPGQPSASVPARSQKVSTRKLPTHSCSHKGSLCCKPRHTQTPCRTRGPNPPRADNPTPASNGGRPWQSNPKRNRGLGVILARLACFHGMACRRAQTRTTAHEQALPSPLHRCHPVGPPLRLPGP